MKRTLVVIVLAFAALALLVGAALKSRAIPLEAHIAQYTLTADVARIGADFAALVTALDTAWQSGQAPGDAASALHERLHAGIAGLEQSAALVPASAIERERMQNHLDRIDQTMATVDSLTATLLRQESEYAGHLARLREGGPEVVQQLRAASLTRAAANVFQLLAGTLEYASSAGTTELSELRRLLVTLDRDLRLDQRAPAEMAELLGAVRGVVDLRDDISSRLRQLAASPLRENGEALALAAGSAYQNAAASAESARTMLSVYAVVMLLAVGVIGYRLQGSYRALNRANTELGVLNESLEQRVEARTEDLSTALAELKESQVQLVQAEKMSSLGQLVAGISHEINTPLLYLANNAEMIRERVAPLSDFVRRSAETLSLNPAEFAERTEYQQRLISGMRTLKNLLREHELDAAVEEIVDLNRDSIEGLADLTEMAQSLKDFSRLDRAPVDSFDVNAGLDKTLTIARNIVKHKAEVRKFYGELPTIECSPSKINQVFLNLITNAAQAIEDSGEIVISTKRQGDDRIVVSIADTGCGIPEENLARIRDPFFTTKEVGSGTGLGLSIVDEIVRSHGGELLVESKVGVGSTFSVVLPVRQQDARGGGGEQASGTAFDESAPDGADTGTAAGDGLAEAV